MNDFGGGEVPYGNVVEQRGDIMEGHHILWALLIQGIFENVAKKCQSCSQDIK